MILSHRSRFTRECNKEDITHIDDDDDDDVMVQGLEVRAEGHGLREASERG